MKLGIIGAGSIAGTVSETLRNLKCIERYAIASRSLTKARAFAQAYGYQKAYGSYEELVSDPEVDLVYVATLHPDHLAHASLALNAGKAVLLEKAFTLDSRQAEELIALAHKKKVFLAEAMWTRYMPFRHKIEEVVGSGVIGETRMISASLSYPMRTKERIIRPELGGGVLLDLGVYPLNFVSMIFGNNVQKVSSTSVEGVFGVDMQDSIALEYADGRLANIFCSAEVLGDNRAVIYGEKGYIEVTNCNNFKKMNVYQNGELIEKYDCGSVISGYEFEFLECKESLDRGLLEAPSMPHAETLAIMQLIDRIRECWK